MPKLNIDGGNKDYTIQQMLEHAQQYVNEEEEKHPAGFKGAFIVFCYSEDREELAIESNDPKDNAYTYMCSGLSNDQMHVGMEKLRIVLNKQQMRVEAEQIVRREISR